MTSTIELSQVNLLAFDREGVGRGNLLKVALINSKLIQQFPNIVVNSVGLYKPESGRTTIHEDVIAIAKKRMGTEVSGWPVTLITPNHVNSRTIAVGLCEPEYIPPFMLEQAFDVLLSPITDPFGADLKTKIETTVSQIAFIDWLLYITLTRRFSDLGTSRDEHGIVIPRHLTQFEPRGIEREYSLDGWPSQFGMQ